MLRGMPRPLPDRDSQPFWDGCQDGRFLLPVCAFCDQGRWPPGPMCPACQSRDTNWVESAGRGEIYSWIVANHPVDPGLADQVPYVVALIELDHGVRVVGNVSGCEPDQIEAGMAVECYFEELEGGSKLPNFRAAGSES